jgi:hypothetical protein
MAFGNPHNVGAITPTTKGIIHRIYLPSDCCDQPNGAEMMLTTVFSVRTIAMKQTFKWMTALLCLLGTVYVSAEREEYVAEFEPVVRAFTGLSQGSHAMIQAAVTDDFLLLEVGEVWDLDFLLSLVEPSEDVRRNYFDVISIDRFGQIAHINYWNKAVIESGSETRVRAWLESVLVLKTAAGWRLKQMHSTRIDPESLPGGIELTERFVPSTANEIVPVAGQASSKHAPSTVKQHLDAFAAEYTKAWNSQDPWQVASFYEPSGSLSVNEGEPAVGREAVAAVAASFMSAFPDLELLFDGIEYDQERVNFHWTFRGTNSGPGGTGNRVDFSGFESWVFGENGLVLESLGQFDAAEYQRQLEGSISQ